MRWRPLFWILVSVACFVGAAYFWRLGNEQAAREKAARDSGAAPASPSPRAASADQQKDTPASTAPVLLPLASTAFTNAAPEPRDRMTKYRLSNAAMPVKQWVHNERAVLLANAFIDAS